MITSNQPDSIVEFWHQLPENEKALVDFLRILVLKTLPSTCREKLTNHVPYYFGNQRICMIWPASVKGGGVKKGVLFGFSRGVLLSDPDQYLTHGSNKRIFYKIFQSVEDIEIRPLINLLNEAVRVDSLLKKKQ